MGNGEALPLNHSKWTTKQLENVRFFMIKFVAFFKLESTGQDPKPSKMKSYILGIKRGFASEMRYKIPLLSGDIFGCPRKGLMSVSGKKAPQLQTAGLHSVSHNNLSKKDLERLYRSEYLNKETPSGYQALLVFYIGLLTAFRPTTLATLSISQFQKMKLKSEWVWKITGMVGPSLGASKTSAFGFAAIGQKAVEIFVYNENDM